MNKLALFILLLTASFNVFSHNVPELMKKCSLEQNALKRLVCFDEISQNQIPSHNKAAPTKQVIAPISESPKQSIVATASAEPMKKPIETSTPVETVRQSTRYQPSAEDFGLKRHAKYEESGDNVVAKVQSFRKNPFKKYIITLDNGQVWKQFDSNNLKIIVGETVTIKRGKLGTFFLSKDGVSKRLRLKRLQ